MTNTHPTSKEQFMFASKPASEKQVRFISRLVKERDLSSTPELQRLLDRAREDVMAGRMTGLQASTLISGLLNLPKATAPTNEDTLVEAEPGFYVRDGEAFKVVMNKAKTHTYALVWSGDSWDYSPGSARNLRGLIPMTGEQAAALGLASGRCINCLAVLGGSTLSAQCSALIGYGETCARRNGWSYPKGAKAQREFLSGFSCPAPSPAEEWAEMKNLAAQVEAEQERAVYMEMVLTDTV